MQEEKIDLKKYKEAFKILPEKDYIPLEQALEKGLYLTPQGVEGGGRLENEKLAKALPSLHAELNKIETLQKKQKQEQRNEGFAYYLREENWSAKTQKVNEVVTFAGGLGGGWGLTVPIIIYLADVCPLAAGLLIYPMIFGMPMGIGVLTYMASSVVIASGICANNAYRKKKVKRKIKNLPKKIQKATKSTLGYTQKWLRWQEKELLQILDSEDTQVFVKAYNEVEKRLVPLHKLELHKNIEQHLYKEWEKEQSLEGTTRKFCKAKNAGIKLDSMEQEIKQELSEKHKYHTKEAREIKKLMEKI